jgi:hypothetical protein
MKSQFKEPTFYVLPHLRYTFYGPTQSAICLMYILLHLSVYPHLTYKTLIPMHVLDLILAFIRISLCVPSCSSCEHGNEPSGSIKYWEVLGQLHDW